MIFGSGNQDPQSWYHSREDNLLVDDPTETIRVRQLLQAPQQSLQHCFHDKYGEKEGSWDIGEEYVGANTGDIPEPDPWQ